MKYNLLFLLRFAWESRKKSRNSARKFSALHQIPTHLHKSAVRQPLRWRRRAGAGGFGGGGEADFSAPARGSGEAKIYNTVTFHYFV